jgi:cobalt/nickel transport system permease protein
LVSAAGAAFCFSAIRGLAPSCLCLAFGAALAALRGFPVLPLLKRLAAANVFVLFIWLTVPPTLPGEAVAVLGPLAWSREGVALAALITVKSNAILLSFLALLSGTSLPLVGCALERLRAPAKLAFLFLFTCRQIQVVGEEWQRLWTAAKLRGFVPRNSPHTYRTIGNLLGLLFVNAADRSRRMHEAMLLRGFEGRFHSATELKGSPADRRFALAFFAVLAGLLLLDRHPGAISWI